jgi:hypothetical protein
MRLAQTRCWELLRSAEHGALSTFNERRVIDSVPICFAILDQRVVTAVDDTKPKRTTELGRLRNLDGDPAATLLCDHWDKVDWTQLWWVRAHLQRVPLEQRDVESSLLDDALRQKYHQYIDATFAHLLVFEVVGLAGWSAEPDEGGNRQHR